MLLVPQQVGSEVFLDELSDELALPSKLRAIFLGLQSGLETRRGLHPGLPLELAWAPSRVEPLLVLEPWSQIQEMTAT